MVCYKICENSLGFSQKVLLLVDNAACHSDFSFASSDNHIVVKFQPANTTNILQPMDQGECEQLKHCYRRCYYQIHPVRHTTWTSSRKSQLRIAFTLLQRHGTRLLVKAWNKVYSDPNGSSEHHDKRPPAYIII